MSAVFRLSGNDWAQEEIIAPICRQCATLLILHQPDPELPNRLLAVCETCKSWYIYDLDGLLLTPISVGDGPRPLRPKRRG